MPIKNKFAASDFLGGSAGNAPECTDIKMKPQDTFMVGWCQLTFFARYIDFWQKLNMIFRGTTSFLHFVPETAAYVQSQSFSFSINYRNPLFSYCAVSANTEIIYSVDCFCSSKRKNRRLFRIL